MEQQQVQQLKEKWLASGSFSDEQAYLRAKTDLDKTDYVYLDPDGSSPPWLAVVVRRQTNVIYGTQCAGLACDQRYIEGFLVPLVGWNAEMERGKIRVSPFTDIFHAEGGCRYGWNTEDLPDSELNRLRRLVRDLPFWDSRLGVGGQVQLEVDLVRLDELVEAWVPVLTPYGDGVLLYPNCD